MPRPAHPASPHTVCINNSFERTLLGSQNCCRQNCLNMHNYLRHLGLLPRPRSKAKKRDRARVAKFSEVSSQVKSDELVPEVCARERMPSFVLRPSSCILRAVSRVPCPVSFAPGTWNKFVASAKANKHQQQLESSGKTSGFSFAAIYTISTIATKLPHIKIIKIVYNIFN